jgi:uncharacterized membrane protein
VTVAFEFLALCAAAIVISAGKAAQQLGNVPVRQAHWLGGILYALTLLVFGTQHFMYAHFVAGLIPVWIPWRLFLAYFTGLCFVAAGVSILFRKFAVVAAILLMAMFLTWFVGLHVPRVVATHLNGNEVTSALIALAMGGAALIGNGVMPRRLL